MKKFTLNSIKLIILSLLKPEKYTIHGYLIEHKDGICFYEKTMTAASDGIKLCGWKDKDVTWTWLYKKDE